MSQSQSSEIGYTIDVCRNAVGMLKECVAIISREPDSGSKTATIADLNAKIDKWEKRAGQVALETVKA